MARYSGGFRGNISGKLGNLVFRTVNGKNFISVRPKKYKSTNNPNQKRTNDAFTLGVRFASFVNAIPE